MTLPFLASVMFADNLPPTSVSSGITPIVLVPSKPVCTQDHNTVRRMPQRRDIPVSAFYDAENSCLTVVGDESSGTISYEIISEENKGETIFGQGVPASALTVSLAGIEAGEYTLCLTTDGQSYIGTFVVPEP